MDPGSWKSEFLATIDFCKGPRATGVLCCGIILCWYKKRILWMSRKRAERASAVIDRSQSPRVRSDLPGISLFTKLLPLLQSSPPPAAHAHFTSLVGKQPKKHLLIARRESRFTTCIILSYKVVRRFGSLALRICACTPRCNRTSASKSERGFLACHPKLRTEAAMPCMHPSNPPVSRACFSLASLCLIIEKAEEELARPAHALTGHHRQQCRLGCHIHPSGL